ncbi:MAG: MFS transporter [Anaerolineales bacterium]|nr:MFS transporter [Anaerolineales bacterium]
MATEVQVRSQGKRNREHWAWYLYDFGNSAYAAVVLLAVYSAYFQGTVVGGKEGTRLWGIAVGIAMLVVAVIAPVLGAIADFSASKKRFLLGFSLLCWTSTALLFFVEQGTVLIGVLFFVMAEIGYRGGQVFYNSLLPEITTPKDLGRVSGNGWAIGSLGGILCLLLILPAILFLPDLISIKGSLVVRSSMVFTAIFFALSSIPAFLWIREKAKPQSLPKGETYLSIGFKRLQRTFKAVRQFREFIKFIVAFLIYNDGIIMALDFAAIIGAVLFGMNQTQLILMMIMVQVTSVAGAYLFGMLGDRIGFKPSLYVSLGMMTLVVIWMVFCQDIVSFFVIAGLAGFALTGVQSISRTLAGLFAPSGQSAEFYGFFSVAGRTSSFIGPTIYGLLAAGAAGWFQKLGYGISLAEQLGQRAGIVSIAIFLVIGTVLLLTVNEKRARLMAQQYVPATD